MDDGLYGGGFQIRGESGWIFRSEQPVDLGGGLGLRFRRLPRLVACLQDDGAIGVQEDDLGIVFCGKLRKKGAACLQGERFQLRNQLVGLSGQGFHLVCSVGSRHHQANAAIGQDRDEHQKQAGDEEDLGGQTMFSFCAQSGIPPLEWFQYHGRSVFFGDF